jgi:hypothetical protein
MLPAVLNALPGHLPSSFWLYCTIVSLGKRTASPPMAITSSAPPKKERIAEIQASCRASALVTTGRNAIFKVERARKRMKKSWRLAIFSTAIYPSSSPSPGSFPS